MKILELGCGNRKGYQCPYNGKIIGVDIDKNSQADVIWDLEKYPYPFKDNEFDAIYSRHALEHLEDTVRTMKELHRITKPHGRIYIIVPHFASNLAHDNVTHKKFFGVNSFNFWEYTSKDLQFKILGRKLNYVFKGTTEKQSWKGKLLRKLVIPIDWLINRHPTFFEKVGILPPDEIEWELEVIK
jgi:SAM-dependent methyltransferase